MHSPLTLALGVTHIHINPTTAFTPKSNAELKVAIAQCLQATDYDCSKGPHGPIGSWDVSAVPDMRELFVNANWNRVPKADKFNGDLSKWDVSRVTNMNCMFRDASSFNGDLSKWDVSRVTNMQGMFRFASSFKQTLCGKWQTSAASKDGMFDGSGGRIGTCTSKTISIRKP